MFQLSINNQALIIAQKSLVDPTKKAYSAKKVVRLKPYLPPKRGSAMIGPAVTLTTANLPLAHVQLSTSEIHG